MAETLGSLVDKVSIKNLRLWHLDEAIEALESADPQKAELQAKRDLAARQNQDLIDEANAFFVLALEGKVKIRDEKLKLYQNRNVKKSDAIKEMGEAISELSVRNIRLWHLEDEARRTDLPAEDIVQVKRKIDATNQERNDLMDKVDEIMEQYAAKFSASAK
ncbi:MAG: DUF4254 domain-containing protein [Candidatus Nitrohelix vancouverensis]|uniref:DUF4254 domain-containing protein n=1 Tax=Candidatus Nitrohelix vancouverensis TaxID=2705534 RepID=A0A7T0BZP1_9BACT|nr:MAG: DUF4254 domain-containing protein [Candidatus Nitrohelix vancouverensis]